jgi:hypothetical protein
MRRLVNKGSTTAWSSTLTRRTAGTLRAATATETASSGIALAAVADRQHPHPGGGQGGRHVQDLFAVADQPLGQLPTDPGGAPPIAQQRRDQRAAHWRSCW